MNETNSTILPFIPAFVILVLAGSVLSTLKTALANVRKPRLQSLETEGHGKYRDLFDAAYSPDRWLDSLTIGIIFAEVLAGCLGVFVFLPALEHPFVSLGLPLGAARAAAFFLIAAGVMILFFVFGEAIPRQIALLFSEEIAAALFPLVRIISIVVFPFFSAGQGAAALIRKLFSSGVSRREMTEDELHHALLEGEKSGVVESEERTMVEGVFYLGDKPVSVFMTHRSEIIRLDINSGAEETKKAAENSGSQFAIPVVSDDPDEVIGMVLVQDIYRSLLRDPWPGLRSVMRQPYFIPETMSALKAFESFKKAEASSLFVMDEYGGFAGILTVRNLIEEIVGELSASGAEEETIKKQDDGTWLASGGVSIDDAAGELKLDRLGDNEGEYHTLAGFVLYLAGEIPGPGEHFDYNGYRFKILSMDNNRIDKIAVSKIGDSGAEEA